MIAYVSLAISIIGILISIGTLVATSRRDKNSLGVSEENTYSKIQDAEDARADFSMNLALKAEAWEVANKPNKYTMSTAERTMEDHKIERILNAYDIACQRYIDKKLDRARFRKTYRDRIKKICDLPDFKVIKDRTTHSYTALNQVNDELSNPEKN